MQKSFKKTFGISQKAAGGLANIATQLPKTAKITNLSGLSLAIPGSAKALAFGLPKRPKGTQVEVFETLSVSVPKMKISNDLAKVGTFGITRRMMGTATKTKSITGTTDITKLQNALIYGPATKTKAITKFRNPLDTAMRLSTIDIVQPITKQRVDTATITKIIPITRTIQRQRMDYKFTMPPIITPVIKTPDPPPPTTLLPPKMYIGKPSKALSMPKQSGFRLEVRRKGKWMPAFKGVFTKESAHGLAQQLVGGTPLASYRISKAYGIPKMVAGLPKYKPEQFRMQIKGGKKVPSGVFVEKTKFRIDTPGEFKGITSKGLEALSLWPAKRRKKETKSKKKRR